MGCLHFQFSGTIPKCIYGIERGTSSIELSSSSNTYIFARTFVLSIRCPSSSCSATSRTGNLAGIIRRGVDPVITEYLEKSETPHVSRRKSSSVSRSPFTIWCGARSIARIASENIVYCSLSVLKRPRKAGRIIYLEAHTGFLKSFL